MLHCFLFGHIVGVWVGLPPPHLSFLSCVFLFQNSDGFLLYACSPESSAAVSAEGLVCFPGSGEILHFSFSKLVYLHGIEAVVAPYSPPLSPGDTGDLWPQRD